MALQINVMEPNPYSTGRARQQRFQRGAAGEKHLRTNESSQERYENPFDERSAVTRSKGGRTSGRVTESQGGIRRDMIRGDEEEKREETRRDVRGSVVVNKYSREVSGGKEDKVES